MTMILPPVAQQHPALVVPGGAPGFTRSGSGLLVPGGLQAPSAGGIIVAEAEDLERVPQLAAQRRDELAATHGAPAADAMLGASMQVVDRAHAQIVNERIVAAFKAGNMAAALAAASQR